MEVLLIIIIATVVLLLGRPKPPEPIVISIDRTTEPSETAAGGCLPLILTVFVVGVLLRLLSQ